MPKESTPAADVTLGEIYRLQQDLNVGLKELRDEVRTRHHDINDKVGVTTVKQSVLEERLNTMREDIIGLGTRLTEEVGARSALQRRTELIEIRAASISGGIAVLIWLVSKLWK